MGLLSFLFSLSEEEEINKKKKKKNKLEEEMDIYGLSDEEKELVRKGEQDVTDFDEEDNEDDDYYEDN